MKVGIGYNASAINGTVGVIDYILKHTTIMTEDKHWESGDKPLLEMSVPAGTPVNFIISKTWSGNYAEMRYKNYKYNITDKAQIQQLIDTFYNIQFVEKLFNLNDKYNDGTNIYYQDCVKVGDVWQINYGAPCIGNTKHKITKVDSNGDVFGFLISNTVRELSIEDVI